MKKSKTKKKMVPFWKRGNLSDSKKLGNDLSRTEAWLAGRWKKDKSKEKELQYQKYNLKRKGFPLIVEELNRRYQQKPPM